MTTTDERRTQADENRARYAEAKARYEAGLEKARTWVWERMTLPRYGGTRRIREKVTVAYNPDGWRCDGSGSYRGEICATLMQFDSYPHPPGTTGREQWDEDHGSYKVPPYGDIEHSVPTTWKIRVSSKARFGATRGGTWCDRCLPLEFRPQADGSPPPEFGPLAGQEPPKKREPRTEPKDPARYAIPDALDPAKVSYWYRPDRGGDKGALKAWPPQRNTWGQLLYKDMPDGKAHTAAGHAFAEAHWARVRQARKAAAAEIEANPELAAARFARYQTSCCACGRAMWDERSVTYGIGPECRRYANPEFLSRMLEVTKLAFAERELRHDEREVRAS